MSRLASRKVDKFRGPLAGTRCGVPKQKHHIATFKAQELLEILKAEKAAAQVVPEHQMAPGQLHQDASRPRQRWALFIESESINRNPSPASRKFPGSTPKVASRRPGLSGPKKPASTL